MASKGFTGGEKLNRVLAHIGAQADSGGLLRVGFLETAKYPDGTNVAQVAFWNEYGTKTAPPRSFFRNTIAKRSAVWGSAIGKNLVATKYDADKTMARVGEGVKQDIRTSVIETTSPALSPITVMLRGMRSNDPSLVVTGATVGEAAARVDAGKTNYGASTKPLVDSGDMYRSVDYDVLK